MPNSIVEYVEHMGSDLTVVNAARVSVGKFKTEIDDNDIKLLNFLAKNGHKSPFYHPVLSVHVHCPIYVARQIMRHHVGISYNEISGRYVEFTEDFFVPSLFRRAGDTIKQGSLDAGVVHPSVVEVYYREACEKSFRVYRLLLANGVCKEQARGVLPLATFTDFIMTASLYAWFNFWFERHKTDAQSETRAYANEIEGILNEHYPHSWQALVSSIP